MNDENGKTTLRREEGEKRDVFEANFKVFPKMLSRYMGLKGRRKERVFASESEMEKRRSRKRSRLKKE